MTDDRIARIHELLGQTIKEQKERLVANGGDAEHIPQPQTTEEKRMFAAGQLSLALFLYGATS